MDCTPKRPRRVLRESLTDAPLERGRRRSIVKPWDDATEAIKAAKVKPATPEPIVRVPVAPCSRKEEIVSELEDDPFGAEFSPPGSPPVSPRSPSPPPARTPPARATTRRLCRNATFPLSPVREDEMAQREPLQPILVTRGVGQDGPVEFEMDGSIYRAPDVSALVKVTQASEQADDATDGNTSDEASPVKPRRRRRCLADLRRAQDIAWNLCSPPVTPLREVDDEKAALASPVPVSNLDRAWQCAKEEDNTVERILVTRGGSQNGPVEFEMNGSIYRVTDAEAFAQATKQGAKAQEGPSGMGENRRQSLANLRRAQDIFWAGFPAVKDEDRANSDHSEAAVAAEPDLFRAWRSAKEDDTVERILVTRGGSQNGLVEFEMNGSVYKVTDAEAFAQATKQAQEGPARMGENRRQSLANLRRAQDIFWAGRPAVKNEDRALSDHSEAAIAAESDLFRAWRSAKEMASDQTQPILVTREPGADGMMEFEMNGSVYRTSDVAALATVAQPLTVGRQKSCLANLRKAQQLAWQTEANECKSEVGSDRASLPEKSSESHNGQRCELDVARAWRLAKEEHPKNATDDVDTVLVTQCRSERGDVEVEVNGSIYRVSDSAALVGAAANLEAERSSAPSQAKRNQRPRLADLRRAQKIAWAAKDDSADQKQTSDQPVGTSEQSAITDPLQRAWLSAKSEGSSVETILVTKSADSISETPEIERNGELYRINDTAALVEAAEKGATAKMEADPAAPKPRRRLADLRRAQRLAWASADKKLGATNTEAANGVCKSGEQADAQVTQENTIKAQHAKQFEQAWRLAKD